MTRLRFALSGILAAVAGIAAGHLVAGFLAPASSPVLAIGSTVIDLTPTPVKEWAIATFGTDDKLILQGSVLVVTLVLAAVAGLLARRRMPVAVGFIVLLTGLAGAAALLRPAARPLDALPAARRDGRRRRRPSSGSPASRRAASGDVSTGPRDRDVATGPRGSVMTSPGRRHPLGAPAAAVSSAARSASLPSRSSPPSAASCAAGAQTVKKVVLPARRRPRQGAAARARVDGPGISPLRTPTDTFYRVDTNLVVPQVDVDTWSLEVDGMVEQPFTMTFAELAAMPLIERDITMTCVSNEVGGGYIGAARWLGVRLTDVLDRAGIKGSPDQVLSTAVDGFTISTPLSASSATDATR